MLPDDDEWWTKERACRHLGITARTFNRYIDAGVLAVKVNGTVFVQRGPFLAEYRRRLIARRDSRFKSHPPEDADDDQPPASP
ncbi:hypothetical protein ACLBWP_15300 [Microbacterium sp. M1A1_1b]|uniref:DNA-binding protein n=1 Tax=Curtobacterium salicis TaxID=1779862 RepID=A0ABX0T1U1_9MICO|nr:hypothetical protein [Curtobacterium sp. WW7]NII39467.1 hypothetical protein [Curtobacterium sp. WW7]